ncbi:MAG: NUDIX hydrolase [Gammaproteobacteria bacterium]|nr:NUDIX hydrolase [Gammaproteobacteria bacterium]MCW8911607.1 NUDIX hydrolase [Gammaproteobacteria bacterium]MCW9004279.1 NUDIX hydrolase [Gammaproteobacteria bacterium]MCW9055555.1 NUDIX hydrolase [Gammaproteobacteria bacterium]
MDKKRKNPWSFISTKKIYDNPWIRIQEDQIVNPAGKPGIYGKVCFKSQAVGIIPVDAQGNTWLVGQHRYTLNEWSWEIPMGGSPLGEDCQKTALRELEEETGLTAGNLQQILYLHTSNSITDEEAYVFLASDLGQGVMSLEDTEHDLEVKKLPLSEAVKMAQNGQITDAISVAGLLHLALLADKYGIKYDG